MGGAIRGKIASYGLGQFVFLAWPAYLGRLGYGNSRFLFWSACLLAGIFAALTFLTLLVPIGDRRRYSWLGGPSPRTGYERLFLGQMQPDLLLSARGLGIRSCRRELLMYIVLTAFLAACTQYSIWLYQRDAAMVVAKDAAMWKFFYWSAITISTTGYGDIYPKGVQSQVVAVLELILGWIYLVGLLPSIITQAASSKGEFAIPTTSERDPAIRPALVRAITAFRASRQPSGGWRADLLPDLAASAFAYRALDHPEFRDARVDRLLSGLRKWITAEAILHAADDPVGAFLARVSIACTMEVGELDATLSAAKVVHAPEEHSSMLLGVYAEALGLITPSVFTSLLPIDLASWDLVYGPHWGTYAVIAMLLKANDVNDEERVQSCITSLLSRRSRAGSWYGDVLLTSAAVLALGRVKRAANVRLAARVWLLDVARSAPANSGLPVVRGLDTWDTALVLWALLASDVSAPFVSGGLEWLAKKSVKGEGTDVAWSWSEESDVICCDTSSLACAALARGEVRNVNTEAKRRSCIDLLRSVRDENHRWPTFIYGQARLHNCPVISARCVATLGLSSSFRRDAADRILGDVAHEGWTSEWFTGRAITEGLVLFHLASSCANGSSAGREVAEHVLALSEHVEESGVEAASAVILAVSEGARYGFIDLVTAEAVRRRLVGYLLSQEDGGRWSARSVGIFGFGRRYGDNLFASALAFRALCL